MKKLRPMLAGVAVGLGLAYGATQAFASASQVQGEYCMTGAERTACSMECASQGMFGVCDPMIGCYCEP